MIIPALFHPRLDPSLHSFLRDDGLLALAGAAKKAGITVRLVGGAVRDALAGRPVGDLDLAADAPPQDVGAALAQAGIKTIPTGIEHGTLTAIYHGKPYEITSLRQDIATDGRHADVLFTRDWQADSARRDLTINALYADLAGHIFDYHGGLQDLARGRVRFIGNPRERIAEDYLRILRFFRFSAAFGQGALDPDALAACADMADGIDRLSVERIWKEIGLLLVSPQAATIWAAMDQAGIAHRLIQDHVGSHALAHMIANESRAGIGPDKVLRLAALLPASPARAQALAARWHFSTKERDQLETTLRLAALLDQDKSDAARRRHMYLHGPDLVRGAALLACENWQGAEKESLCQMITTWKDPVFPIRGQDMLDMGMAPGPAIAALLRQTEDWWIEQAFEPGRTACLDHARALWTQQTTESVSKNQ